METFKCTNDFLKTFVTPDDEIDEIIKDCPSIVFLIMQNYKVELKDFTNIP